MSILQVNIENFEQVVINGSFEKPIAVAFEVSPALEKLSNELKFAVAKLDGQDSNNQQIAAYLQIQAIDDIRVMKDGQVAGGASGAASEEDLKKELAKFFVSEEELQLANAEEQLNLGETDAALNNIKKIYGKNPANKKAAYLLAKAQTLSGKKDEAKQTIQSIKDGDDFYKDAQSLLELMDLDEETKKLVIANKHREALEKFLIQIENNQDKDGSAKKAMITLFSVLGPKHELTWEYRAKLNRLIYV